MSYIPPELYSVKRIRALEKAAMEEYDIPGETLMSRAGSSAYIELMENFSDMEDLVVICGKGNNGGDGYVLAYLANGAGLNVTVYHLGKATDLSGSALKAYESCQQARIDIVPFFKELDLDVDVIVDAVLGIGIKGQVKGEVLTAIQCINESDAEVLAMDIPSGLDADTGSVHGEAVFADVTVTFMGVKPGLITHQGPGHCGEVICHDLDLPDELYESVSPSAYHLSFMEVYEKFGPRDKAAHKGYFGHVLVIGGDYGMPGAVRMAGEAAMRVGAGLVTIATRPEHIAAVTAARPELMCHGVSKASDLKRLFAKASVVVIGPGLGESEWSKSLFNAALKSGLPMVIDASALHILAEKPSQKATWILTPHPGEAASLLNVTPAAIQADRLASAKKLQKQYAGIVVLKGTGTIVRSLKKVPEICTAGNPGMASGGMGDILSGVIAGLVAQGFSLADAARLGVIIHASAGDLAAEEGERGMIATDLLPLIRDLVNPNLGKEELTEYDFPGFEDLFESEPD